MFGALSLLSPSGFFVLFPCMVASGFSELIPWMVALGFLLFPKKCISVSLVCLVVISVSESFLLNSTKASDGMVLFRMIAQLQVWWNVNPRSCAIFTSNVYTASRSGTIGMFAVHQSRFVLGEFCEIGQRRLQWVIAEKKHACLPLRSPVPPAIKSSFNDWPAIIRRSCMVDVNFPLIRNVKQRKEFGTNSWYATVTWYRSWCTEVFHMGQVNISNLTLCDAADNASNHLLKFQDRVLGSGSHILCINFGQCTAPSGSRGWGSCRRTVWAVFEIGFGLRSYFCEVRNW